MSAHTPGPWRVEDVIGDGPIDICAPDIYGQGSPNLIATALADLGCGGFVSLEHAIANARLIAEAPELLRLLKKASPAVAELHGQGIGCPDCPSHEAEGPWPTPPEECPFMLAIDATIAKAEGR